MTISNLMLNLGTKNVKNRSASGTVTGKNI